MGVDSSDRRVIIAGAGPAGLTAAHELVKHGITGTILEADQVVGGISRTVQRDGYRFDIGGHRFFSKSQEVRNLWDEMLSEPMLLRPRLSRIYYGNKFYDYPLKASNALGNVGLLTAIKCMTSYGWAKARPMKDPQTLKDWVTNQFGARLYRMFFETYTEKVWGIPCTEIGADWAAQRIKGMNLGEAVRNALFGQGKGSRLTTLIDEFHYPRLGPGQLWEDCAKSVQRAGWEIRLGTRLIGTQVDNGRIVGVTVSDSGGTAETLPCTEFISSVPLRELIAGIRPVPAETVTSAAGRLAYRDFVTVALILDAKSVFPDNWIYIHEPEVKLGRIQNFKNWSPDMVPDPARTCLGLEYFCNEGDSLWCSTDAELVQLGYEEIRRIRITDRPLLGGYVVRMPKAYPVYDTGYRERLDCLREYLSSIRGLYCVGRNGQHRYNNMDHSMVTALLAARNIAQGQTNDPWAVNEDAEYHEVAGPQDPLKA